MDTTKITLVTVGHPPPEFDKSKFSTWNSTVFSIVGEVENFSLNSQSDEANWGFSDENLEAALPQSFSGDFLIAIVNVPLQKNWYSRRLKKNRVVITAHEITEILQFFNIPFENFIYRLLYAYTLHFKRNGNYIPLANEKSSRHTHDETRGCLFDMNGIKTDIHLSCDNPIICPECVEELKKDRVSTDIISKVQTEIKKIKRPLFYRLLSFVKKRPIISLTISICTALVVGIIGSYIASYLFEITKNEVTKCEQGSSIPKDFFKKEKARDNKNEMQSNNVWLTKRRVGETPREKKNRIIAYSYSLDLVRGLELECPSFTSKSVWNEDISGFKEIQYGVYFTVGCIDNKNQKNGPYISLYKEGEIIQEGEYRNGKLSGIMKTYSKEGKLINSYNNSN